MLIYYTVVEYYKTLITALFKTLLYHFGKPDRCIRFILIDNVGNSI